MKQIKIEKTQNELLTIYDTRQSFYKKAIVTTLKYENTTTHILKSYDSIVATITKCENGEYFYINNNICDSLLYSNTTLRHIKEFLKQYYKNIEYKKSDLIKNEYNTQFLQILEENDGITLYIENYQTLANATSKETTKFFKNAFDGYKEKKEYFNNDVYILTSSKYGFANHYYIKLSDRV